MYVVSHTTFAYSLSKTAMVDPSLSHNRKHHHQSPKKIKLLCRFNGKFQPRPPSAKLRYTGGDTRIISVDRNISFTRLKSKISELVFINSSNSEGNSFSLVYHRPECDSAGGDLQLAVVTSDDDVRCMIEEYDKVELEGKISRVWIYVCNVNGLGLKLNSNNVSVNCVQTEDFCNGVMRKKSGFECRNSTKKLGKSVSGVRCSDDSLRKLVLKQQLLAKQRGLVPTVAENEMECSNEHENYDHPVLDLASESQSFLSNETIKHDIVGNSCRRNSLEYKYTNSNLVGSENFGNLAPLPVSHSHPLSINDGNLESERNSCLILGTGAGTSSGSSTHLISGVQFPKPFYNPKMNSVVTRSGKIALLNNMNRENIVPCGLDCNTVRTELVPFSSSCELGGSVYSKSTNGSSQSRIRGHRFGLSETRNQRTCLYQIRNHRSNLIETGNHRNVRLESRPWVGKYYPGLKSISNISKQGMATRSYYRTSSKPWSASHCQKEGLARTTEGGLNSQIDSYSVPYGKPNPKECHLVYHGASTAMAEQTLLSQEALEKLSPCTRALNTQIDLLASPSSEQNEALPIRTLYNNLEMPMNKQEFYVINEAPYLMDQQEDLKKPSPCTRALDTQIDLLTGSVSKQHEVSNQTSYSNLEIPMNEQDSYDINEAPYLMDQHEVGISTALGCNGKFSDVEAGCKSFSNHQNGPCTVQGGIASCVDLSLHNLSLSSSEHVEPPPISSPRNANFSEVLLKPQSKPYDLMDDEQFSSAPQVEKSSGVASLSPPQNEAKMGKDNDEKTEIEQDPQSGLSSNEKECIKKTDKNSKVNGVIPLELAAFYTHLATRELQTIKTSDLEYVKELGSGTYGTVFYGKWKGSDVAIKRIKPSCFSESAVGKDRLVADFWKEAHILGQLHHPNIVALYGVVTDGPVTSLATVTEYMVNGSLKQVLRRKDRTIDRRKRLIIAMDAAFGMEYLHEKSIVHFDLKSHNFLVNMRDPQRPVCKIGDLGLSKIKQKTLISGGVRGTIPWMAPELLNSKNMVTEKVDVYSFGIVMWELLTGEEPYLNLRSEEIIAGIIKGNLRPEIPHWCDPAWRSVMERCWSSDPDARPTFSEIAKELRAMAAAMNIK